MRANPVKPSQREGIRTKSNTLLTGRLFETRLAATRQEERKTGNCRETNTLITSTNIARPYKTLQVIQSALFTAVTSNVNIRAGIAIEYSLYFITGGRGEAGRQEGGGSRS